MNVLTNNTKLAVLRNRLAKEEAVAEPTNKEVVMSQLDTMLSMVDIDMPKPELAKADADAYSQIKEKAMQKYNVEEGDTMMSRKGTEKMMKESRESYVNLLRTDFKDVKNADVVTNAVNRVINEANGLSPMVTIATKKIKNKAENKREKEVVKTKTTVSLGLVMRGKDRFNREVTDFTRALTKYVIGGSIFKYTEKDLLMDDYVVLKADSNSIKEYAARVFYVDFEKGIFAVNAEEGVVNLMDGEVIENIDRLNQYMFLGASASALREKFGFYGGVLAKTYDYKSGASRTIANLVDKVCDGIMTHAKDRFTEIEAAKFSTRHMQYGTSSISMGELGRVAKINGFFDTGLMELVKDSIKFTGKGGTFDGVVYMPASVIAKMFNCNEDIAQELCLQARPGSLKVQVQVVNDNLFYLLLRLHKAFGTVTTYGQGKQVSMLFDLNAQKAEIDLENLELEVLKVITKKPSKPSKGLLEKVIVGALEDDIMANVVDANGVIQLNNFNNVIDRIETLGLTGLLSDVFNVLAGKKLMVSDLNNTAAICNTGVNTIPAAISSEVKNVAKSAQNNINKLSYGKDIIEYLTITTDPGMLFGIKLLNRGEIFIPSKKNRKDINRIVAIKYPTMGMKEFYSGDLIDMKEMESRIINANMPKLIEVAFKSEAKEMLNRIKRSLLDAYRKMSSALVVLPASMEVFNSCAGLDVDTDAMAIVYDDVLVNTLYGKEELIELGKLESEKAGNKGKDNKKANDIWNSLPTNSRLSAKQKEKVALNESNKYLYTNELFYFAKAYINASRGNTESIGSISNSNSKMIALYVQALLGNMEGFNVFFKENFGTQKKGANKKYVGLDAYKTKNKSEANGNGKVYISKEDYIYFVDETIIDNIIEEAKEMDITDRENVLRLLRDVNRIFRFYQEKTIDMAKTGGTLNVRFSCNSIVALSLVNCKVIDIDNTKGNSFNFKIVKEMPTLKELDIRIKDKNNQVIEEFKMNQVIVSDPMADVQDMLIEEANKRIDSLVSEYKVLTFQQLPGQKVMNKNAVLTSVEVLDENGETVEAKYYDMSMALDRAHNKLASAKTYNTMGLYEFKALYVALAKQFIEDTKGLDPKENEEVINAYRNQFKSKLEWIMNSCEWILSDVNTGSLAEDYVTRGMIMLAVGAKANINANINPNSTNRFALNICDHYTKCYALNSNAVVAECKVLQCDESLVGETVTLVNGMSNDMKLVVKDKFKDKKVQVKVVRDSETDEIKVLYTQKIQAVKHDDTKASAIFEGEIIDAVNSKGEKITDAGGNARKTMECEVLASLLKGEFATIEFKEDNDSESFELVKENGEVVEFATDSEIFMDVEPNVVYNVGSAFLFETREGGRVSVELTK